MYELTLGLSSNKNEAFVDSTLRSAGIVSGLDSVKLRWPNAQNELLQRTYYWETFLDSSAVLDSVYHILNVQNVVELSYAQPLSCVNPHIALNDTWYSQNWAGQTHLDLIEAYCAWGITTGNPNIIIGIADTDIKANHEDLDDAVAAIYGPTQPNNYSHGTEVAGAAAAETNNNKGIGAIGYDCSLAIGRVPHSINSNGALVGPDIGSAVWGLYQNGVNIINVSWTSIGGYNPSLFTSTPIAVQEMVDNGVVFVLGAGNNNLNIYHATYADIPGVINVSSVDLNNMHEPTGHAHNQHVDLCAPGTNISTTGDIYPFYKGAWGTSMAAPQVSGTIGLMKSVNPCLTPAGIENILKLTAQPISDGDLFPNQLGSGLLNAHQAVRMSQSFNSSAIDLFIRDRYEDVGNELYPYHWQESRDDSPDIWVRKQNDGLVNQFTEGTLEYESGQPFFIYVRVTNKSCANFSGGGEIKLYGSKASTWSSWPENWDGTIPSLGGLIGSKTIASGTNPLGAGEERIYVYQWLPPSFIGDTWPFCLLARIEGVSGDQITVYPDRIDEDVFYNNNIAMKNIEIVNFESGKRAPGFIGNVYYPVGYHVYIGNVLPEAETFDLSIVAKSMHNSSLVSDCGVSIIFDSVGWSQLYTELAQNPNLTINSDSRVAQLLSDSIYIQGVSISAGMRFPVYFGFSFDIDSAQTNKSYTIKVSQFLSADSSYLGGVETELVRNPKAPFWADAGPDKYIVPNESVVLHAHDIGEAANYLWYDASDSLLHQGLSLPLVIDSTETFKLEVISEDRGYKDIDFATVFVNTSHISNINPNPVNSYLNIDYMVEPGVSSAFLYVMNPINSVYQSFTISPQNTSTSIDVSGFNTGNYNVVLVVDGMVADSKSFIKL